jgi:hypothetical protein
MGNNVEIETNLDRFLEEYPVIDSITDSGHSLCVASVEWKNEVD